MAEHTKTPWIIPADRWPSDGYIKSKVTESIVCVVEPDLHFKGEQLLNMQTIITAVNNHAELVAALEKLTDLWSLMTDQEMYGEHLRDGMEREDFDQWSDAHFDARAALAKARGKQ